MSSSLGTASLSPMPIRLESIRWSSQPGEGVSCSPEGVQINVRVELTG